MKKKKKIILGISLAAILTLSVSAGIIISIRPPWLVEMVAGNFLDSSAPEYPEIEDGLHGLLVGTGSPLPDSDRAGASVLVIAGDKHFVVDTGVGSTENIALSGVSTALVDAVFLTHYHSDHIADLGELMLQRWANGAHNESLPVYGPVNVSKVVEGFNMAYQFDSQHRIDHHGDAVAPENGSGGISIIGTHEIDIGPDPMANHTWIIDDVEVTMFNVNHTPVYPAVGYKFEYKGRSLVISGDTIYSENLELHATNADLLICEALNDELVTLLEEQAAEGNIGGETTETIFHDIQDYHITPWDAATLAKNANVEYLVYTHIIPAVPDALEDLFLGNASEIFTGKIDLADDGLFVSLPANSEKITTMNLLSEINPIPASVVIPISILVLVAMVVVGWIITKKKNRKKLKASTILTAFSILMGILIVTRIVTFITTGFDILTAVYFGVEAIMLTWGIMVLKQDNDQFSSKITTWWNNIKGNKKKGEIMTK